MRSNCDGGLDKDSAKVLVGVWQQGVTGWTAGKGGWMIHMECGNGVFDS